MSYITFPAGHVPRSCSDKESFWRDTFAAFDCQRPERFVLLPGPRAEGADVLCLAPAAEGDRATESFPDIPSAALGFAGLPACRG